MKTTCLSVVGLMENLIGLNWPVNYKRRGGKTNFIICSNKKFELVLYEGYNFIGNSNEW